MRGQSCASSRVERCTRIESNRIDRLRLRSLFAQFFVVLCHVKVQKVSGQSCQGLKGEGLVGRQGSVCFVLIVVVVHLNFVLESCHARVWW